jgi:hypothetical protein
MIFVSTNEKEVPTMKKTLALLLTLTMLLSACAVAHAEGTYRDFCNYALTAFADDSGLEYDTLPVLDLDYAFASFDLVEGTLIVGDSSFRAIVKDLEEEQSNKLMYAFMQAYETLSESVPEDCEDLTIVLVYDTGEDDMLFIDASNIEEAIPLVYELLINQGVPEDDPVFSQEYIDALFPTSSKGKSAKKSTRSSLPNAFDGMDWLGQSLTLTEFYEPEGDELEKLQEELDTSADLAVFCFESPDGDLLQTDVDAFAPMIQLCDEYGTLTEYRRCTSHLSDLEDGHSDEEYCNSFDLVFALPEETSADEFLLFVPGEDDCTIYTYGAEFAVPDRRIDWNGYTLWVATYNDGYSMDEEDFDELAEDEKFLEVGLCVTSSDLPSAVEDPTNIRLEDADGEVTSVSSSVHYQSESVGEGMDECYTWLHLVYVVPEEFDYDYYTIYVDGDYDRALPLVVE